MPKRTNASSSTAQIVDPFADLPPTGTDPVPAPEREQIDPEFEPEPVAPRRLHAVKPDPAPTPEQQRIKELEDRLAKELGRKDPEQEFEVADETGETVLIHFVADGFTALGHVWYRGQEIEFTVGGPSYVDTVNRLGWSWLSLRDDPAAQEERYGEVKFRSGPWKGLTYAHGAAKGRFEPLKDVKPLTEAELAEADRAEARRRRAAPRLPKS